MTSRELVKNTMEGKNTSGRAPRDLWALPWAWIYEKEEYDRVRGDFPSDYSGPRVDYLSASAVEKGDPYELGEYTDPWGCRFVNIQRGVIGEVKHPIVTDDEWEDTSRVVFPEHWLDFDVEQVNAECAKSDKWLQAGFCPRPFEQLQFIRGTENLYIDLIEQPSGFMAFLEKMHDFYCRGMKKWAQTNVDSLMMMDDWGAQRSLLISPRLWRQIFKPMYQDYIDIAHSHGKKISMHSDGYTLEILPDLIDMGLDSFNTQIFCMGIENLAQFKGKITFWGEICRQNILPHGTVQDVEKAVQKVFDTLWDDGRCIAQCEYGAGARPENVYAVYETWDRLTLGR